MPDDSDEESSDSSAEADSEASAADTQAQEAERLRHEAQARDRLLGASLSSETFFSGHVHHPRHKKWWIKLGR